MRSKRGFGAAGSVSGGGSRAAASANASARLEAREEGGEGKRERDVRARRWGFEPGGAVDRDVARAVLRVDAGEGRSDSSSAWWRVAEENVAASASRGERMARSSAGRGGVLYVSACVTLIAWSAKTVSAS